MGPARTILLVSLDCVRREALGCFPVRYPSAAAPNTPVLDAIAARGARFDQAITQAPFTPASHASILTGLNPPRHGVRRLVGQRLADGATPLAEILSGRGYRCAAFVGSHALSRAYGLDRGFELYDDVFDSTATSWLLGYRRSCEESTERALAWLEQASSPRFLFIHYFDAHDVDNQPETATPAHQVEQVARIDRQVGRLLAAIERQDGPDSALVVVTADHGDAFGEHGEFNHRDYLYDTTLRIPLLVAGGPFTGGRAVAAQVRAIDIVPTLLDVAGAPPPALLDGAALAPLLAAEKDRPAYSETCKELVEHDWDNLALAFAALRDGHHKLILDLLRGRQELYDLAADPGETSDLAGQPAVATLESELAQRAEEIASAAPDEPGAMAPDEAELVAEQLRGLGYLD
ncbi:MAG: sulfatase [Acidobacteria bacterium]|nr:sulfatase [Acidobacteriota bacterium]